MSAAPKLTRKLALQDPQSIADGAGGFAENWVTLGHLWANVDAGTGNTRGQEVTQVSRISYRITVHGAPEGAQSRPRAGQRFAEGVRVFNILAVTEMDEQGRYLTCFCEEEVGT